MADKFTDRFSTYTPSKTVWFWSSAGCVVATMVVGFTWGGWVTGGTAAENVAQAQQGARATLAASICQERFLAAPDARTQLAALKEADDWKRDTIVEDGGWVTFAAMEEPVDDAGELCADQLVEVELPPEGTVAEATATSVN